MSTISDNCESCGRDYEFRPEVDLAYVYPYQPRFNHVQATCPHCVHTTIIFVDQDALERMLYRDKLRSVLYFAVHTNVAQARCQFDEPVPEPTPKWLSPRDKKAMDYFHDQLERGLQE